MGSVKFWPNVITLIGVHCTTILQTNRNLPCVKQRLEIKVKSIKQCPIRKGLLIFAHFKTNPFPFLNELLLFVKCSIAKNLLLNYSGSCLTAAHNMLKPAFCDHISWASFRRLLSKITGYWNH